MLAHTSPRFQTASTVMSFLVAVLLRPEVQVMAQEELDAVTRRERLPAFEDRPRLPFIDAICKEILRWRPVLPLGELLSLAGSHQCKRFDDLQRYPMKRQEMMSMRGSLSLRVRILSVQICFVAG